MNKCDPFRDRDQLWDTALYHREYSNLEMLHLVESLLKVAAASVIEFSKEINAQFIAIMDHETCTFIIYTYGLGLQIAKTSVRAKTVSKRVELGNKDQLEFQIVHT